MDGAEDGACGLELLSPCGAACAGAAEGAVPCCACAAIPAGTRHAHNPAAAIERHASFCQSVKVFIFFILFMVPAILALGFESKQYVSD
jgi:hypothetical protein